MNKKPFVVVEISDSWIDGMESEEPPISERFENVIQDRHTLGYELVSFTHSKVVFPEAHGECESVAESIIAVFRSK